MRPLIPDYPMKIVLRTVFATAFVFCIATVCFPGNGGMPRALADSLAGSAGTNALTVTCIPGASPVFSGTSPVVNLTHIFCGAINRHGKAVGFHSAPGGRFPPTVLRYEGSDGGGPNAQGIYVIRDIRISDGSKSVPKKSISTMFPDRCTGEEVVNAIILSYRGSERKGARFEGLSPAGVEGACRGANDRPYKIRGYIGCPGYNGREICINTAFPVYEAG